MLMRPPPGGWPAPVTCHVRAVSRSERECAAPRSAPEQSCALLHTVLREEHPQAVAPEEQLMLGLSLPRQPGASPAAQ